MLAITRAVVLNASQPIDFGRASYKNTVRRSWSGANRVPEDDESQGRREAFVQNNNGITKYKVKSGGHM